VKIGAKDDGQTPGPGNVRGRRQHGSIEPKRKRRQRAHGRGGHLRGRRGRARPARRRLPWPWPSSPTRSGPRTWSRHPAGERPVPAVVRRLVEHCLPELVVAAVAGNPDMSHAAAVPCRLPGRRADARGPAHLRHARPQLVSERAALWLVLEQRNGHPNDHAQTSSNASMITAARSEPGPGGVSPGAVIHTGCADRGGGGQSEHRMGLGPRRPRHPQWPGRLPGRAAGPPQQPVPQPGGNALVRSSMLHISRRPGSRCDTTHATR
jgi:hypothetical protein